MKKLFYLFLSIILALVILDEKIIGSSIYDVYNKYYKKTNNKIVTNMNALKPSQYLYNDHSNLIHNADNYLPKNKDELINVYYTVLNNGWVNFSYYCDSSYTGCFDDISDLSNDKKTFSNINQLIHPYNSYNVVKSSYTNDRIDINIEKKYSDEDILKIDKKINSIINELNINDYSNVEDKIKAFHDYIANTNKYDKNKENGLSTYNSDTAIGTLFEGYSICSGYTDTLAIFLSKIGLDNVKIANDKHTWNVVKINNKWKHIDLTWDDPITDTNEDIITYDYFLIDTDKLISKNEEEHNFDEKIFSFLK